MLTAAVFITRVWGVLMRPPDPTYPHTTTHMFRIPLHARDTAATGINSTTIVFLDQLEADSYGIVLSWGKGMYGYSQVEEVPNRER